jgi:DNA-binding IclR family transcriptional regulator
MGLSKGHATRISASARRSKSAPVGVVGKVIRILEHLNHSPRGLLLREVVSLTNINKSTAYRFLSHLENEGYVFRDPNGYYAVGPQLAKFGTAESHHATLCRTSAEVLEKLRTDTGETVNLAVLDRTEILYLSVFESRQTFRMVSEIGTRRPLHCTALGKAILAYLPPVQQKKTVAAIRFHRLTPRTVSSIEKLDEDLLKIRRRAYALDDEEAVLGARCIAVPIVTHKHSVIGAISISGPVVRITKRRVPDFAALLRTAAAEIAQRMGLFN